MDRKKKGKTMKRKRWISLSLVMALMLSLPLPSGNMAFAAETAGVGGVEESAGLPAGAEEKPAETEASDAEGKEEGDVSGNAAPSESDEMPEETISPDSEDEAAEEDGEDGISVMSLLPVTEVKAIIELYGYSREELGEVPLETLLKRMKDSKGNKINIPDDAIVAWTLDENGARLDDEYRVIERGSTVNLSRLNSGAEMQILIGNGKQLDDTATRYLVKMKFFFEKQLSENIRFSMWREYSAGHRSQISNPNYGTYMLKGTDIPVTAVIWNDYGQNDSCYLDIVSSLTTNKRNFEKAFEQSKEEAEDASEHDYYEYWQYFSNMNYYRDIDVEIYPMKEFLKYYQAEDRESAVLEGAITEQILNQENMQKEGGYQSSYTIPGSDAPAEADNFLCIVYKDTAEDKVLAYQGLVFIMDSSVATVQRGIYTEKGGEPYALEESSKRIASSNITWSLDLSAEPGSGMAKYPEGYDSYYLPAGYSVEGTYLYKLNGDDRIKKVTVCQAEDTLEEAAEAEDITDQVLSEGYPVSGTEEITFAVFFRDNTAFKYRFYLYERGGTVNYSYGYNLYTASAAENGYKTRVDGNTIYARAIALESGDASIPVTPVYFQPYSNVGEAGEEEQTPEYYLSMSYYSPSSEIQVDVYPMKDFLEGYDPEGKEFTAPGESITEQIFGGSNAGYHGTYVTSPESPDWEDADNLFCIVYTNAETGKLIAYHGILFVVRPAPEDLDGKLYLYEDAEMKELFLNGLGSGGLYVSYSIELAEEAAAATPSQSISYANRNINLPVGYQLDDGYYYVMEGDKERIDKIVSGAYATPEDAEKANAEDITDAVLRQDEDTAPYGYALKPGEAYYNSFSQYITVFFKDRTVAGYSINISKNGGSFADASYSYYVYKNDENGIRNRIQTSVTRYAPYKLPDASDIPVMLVSCGIPDYAEGETYYLGIYSSLYSSCDIDVKIYPMKQFLEYYQAENQETAVLEGDVTELLREYSYSSKFTFPDSSGAADADNLFCAVYTNNTTQKIMAYQGLLFVLGSDKAPEGNLYSYIDGRKAAVTVGAPKKKSEESSYAGYSYVPSEADESGKTLSKYTAQVNCIAEKVRSTYALPEGYSSGEEYYYALDADERISTVVLGSYDTLEEAEKAEAKDVTSDILPGQDGQEAPGYKAGYDSGNSFTVFYKDGTALKYDVAVECASGVFEDSHTYNVYGEAGSEVRSSKIEYAPYNGLEEIGIPVTEVSYYVTQGSSWKPGDSCQLQITSEIARRNTGAGTDEAEKAEDGLDVKVYPIKEFLKYLQSEDQAAPGNDITDQILNREDTEGYAGNYAEPGTQKPEDMDNLFCIVYTSRKTGEILAYHGILFSICQAMPAVKGSLYAYEDGKMVKLGDDEGDETQSGSLVAYRIGRTVQAPGGTEISYTYVPERVNYTLPEGYTSKDAYYYEIGADEQIEKIVLGSYTNREDAAGAEDITAEILQGKRETLPYGYPISYNRDMDFTILLKNGKVIPYTVRVISGSFSYADQNVIIQKDPWFNVTGAAGYGKDQIYVVENSDVSTLDTYYGYGYQTILIHDPEADLQKLAPEFECRDSEVGAYVRRRQISGVSTQDFSKGPVIYNVFVDNNLRNYQVTFVKKETGGAKLFVNGPDEREIFLTEYFENKHDILIANIGDKELTGLKVEIENASNIRLDDYWNVGGEGNDHLAAFTGTSRGSDYGELMNLAKVRLLPDGDGGEIEGTLVISADGQEPIRIHLTGYAQNPKIITDALDDAVKYVPYSNVVGTDNMYEWNKVTFSLVQMSDDYGRLPEGLSLNPSTGEIYGTPLEEGTFPIIVEAAYSNAMFEPSYVQLELLVKTNSNDNVYNATDARYELSTPIGEESVADSHDFVLKEAGDQLFVSAGEMNEFIALWLNGKRLEAGVDYTAESGSTRVTIVAQTFANKADQTGTNTLAAEFREGSGDDSEFKELRRTAQNFRVEINSESPDDKPGDKPGETPGDKPGDKPGETPGDKPGETPGDKPGETPGDKPGETPGNKPGDNTGGSTGDITGGNGGNTGGTPGGSSGGNGNGTQGNSGAGSPEGIRESNYATLVVRMVDDAGNPLAGLTVEIHSTPKTARTSSKGFAVFAEVEEGKHAIYVKDSTGKVLASGEFEIIFGDTASMSGNQLVVRRGGACTLSVKFDGTNLTFLSQQEGDVYRVLSPGTSDPAKLLLWLALAVISFSMAGGIWLYGRRKRRS